MQQIPLMIITGFLGAGKTSLLNNILNAEHGLKIAVMVNDFGAINIDTQLILEVDEADEIVSLSNGCICCTIRGDLVKAVLQLIQGDDKPELIIIETSGVSDPIDVILTLRAVNAIKIDSVLTVIDAEQILDTPREYNVLMMNQIGTADIVLLNKTDLVDETQLKAVRQHIQQIAPHARVIETAHGNAPLALVLGAGTYDPQRIADKQAESVHVHEGEAHHQHDDHSLVFDTWSWRSTEPVSSRALQRFVNNLPETIYRAKGIFFFADAPERQGLLHVVGKRAEISTDGADWAGQTPYSQFVLIGQQGSINAHELKEQLDACLAANAPKSELERIAQQALSWLRSQRNKVDAG